MSDTPDDLDRLLAGHLRDAAGREDVGALYDRIKATSAVYVSQAGPAKRKRGGRFLKAVTLVAGSAAVLLLALTAFLAGEAQPLRASPQALLQEAQKAHHLPLDRCYLVEVQRTDAPGDEPPPWAAGPRPTRLWTRGDRFWIESTNPRARWAWGRDENGTIWMCPGPRRGIRIDPEEASRILLLNCDVSELRPEHLLENLLRDFDLTRDEAADPNPTTQVIRAERRPSAGWAPPLRTAVLELDSETKVLRRVVLTRAFWDRTVTTTYTLIETDTQPDDKYRLEGHLTAPYEIYSADNHPQRRRDILSMVFGIRGAEWIRPFPKEGPK
jgi:hypothetical protein